MLSGAGLLVAALLGLAALVAITGLSWGALLISWCLVGVGYSSVMTPSGRLLRRSAHAEDRPAIFAAQFALSHACWLLTYPLSGWLMTAFGTLTALILLAALSLVGLLLCRFLWPAHAPSEIPHSHADLPPDHPHLLEHGDEAHKHAIIIDDLHRDWPMRG
jgi:MFS family permease